MAKRKMSENSLKNLEKANPQNNFNNSEVARKAQAKSVEKRKENKDRSEMCNILFDEIYKRGLLTEAVEQASHKAIEKGDIKDLIELLKIVKPNDKQIQEITGKDGAQLTPAVFNILPVRSNNEL